MAGLCAPRRRFAPGLAADARLGADAIRYSFIVVDLHHLLLAGLPARHRRKPIRNCEHLASEMERDHKCRQCRDWKGARGVYERNQSSVRAPSGGWDNATTCSNFWHRDT